MVFGNGAETTASAVMAKTTGSASYFNGQVCMHISYDSLQALKVSVLNPI
jgi:hypothetical protein